jgi:hypothetical protein
MKYSHFCKPCYKFFECTHSDPEKMQAICPIDGSTLYLRQESLEDAIKNLHLSKYDVDHGKVLYKPLH